MNTVDALKSAKAKAIEELTRLEEFARNNEEDYAETVNRIHSEGYLDGIDYALAVVKDESISTTKKDFNMGVAYALYYVINELGIDISDSDIAEEYLTDTKGE